MKLHRPNNLPTLLLLATAAALPQQQDTIDMAAAPNLPYWAGETAPYNGTYNPCAYAGTYDKCWYTGAAGDTDGDESTSYLVACAGHHPTFYTCDADGDGGNHPRGGCEVACLEAKPIDESHSECVLAEGRCPNRREVEEGVPELLEGYVAYPGNV